MKNITFLGDIFLDHRIDGDPFVNVKDVLLRNTLVLANLETVLYNGLDVAKRKRVAIRCTEESVIYLTNNNIGVVNIANNHILDYGTQGYDKTIEILKDCGIATCGVKEPIIIDTKESRIAFFSYYEYGDNNHICRLSINRISEDIKRVRSHTDYIFVMLHWGYEYVNLPTSNQRYLANRIIDAGADCIIGHHPHVVQAIETINGKPVFYSLGNFQFGVDQDKLYCGADYGYIVQLFFINGGIEYKIIPVSIDKEYRPLIASHLRTIDITHVNNDIIYNIFTYCITSRVFLTSQYNSWINRITRYGKWEILKFIKAQFSFLYIKMNFFFIISLVYLRLFPRPKNIKEDIKIYHYETN